MLMQMLMQMLKRQILICVCMQARCLQLEMARFPSFIPMFRVCVYVRMNVRRGP